MQMSWGSSDPYALKSERAAFEAVRKEIACENTHHYEADKDNDYCDFN